MKPKRYLSIENASIYTKFALAALFMFALPLLLFVYTIFFVLPGKYVTNSILYVRIVILWVIASGVIGYIIIRRVISSTVILIKRAKKISTGKVGERLESPQQDELKELASTINKITSDLEKKIKELEDSRNLMRELFTKIGQTITSNQKLEALLSLIAQSMRKALKAESSFIALYSTVDGRLYLKAYAGNQKNLSENMRIADDKGVIGSVVKSSNSMVVRKDGQKKEARLVKETILYNNDIVCAPILERGKVQGVLGITDRQNGENIDEEDIFLLENVASQIATSVDNFELNRDIEETYYETLLMLARVVEAKDPYSAGHLERVNTYVSRMADALKLDDETKKTLVGGAALHDLGKVGIQDSILKKEDKLTPEEYEIIKDHSVIGENILKPLRSMSKLAKLVRHHHELYDGTGYPDGLKGEDIPLISRILTIADIYDSMTTDRPYHKAMPKKEALDTLRLYAGNKVDPKLVEVFIRVSENENNNKA